MAAAKPRIHIALLIEGESLIKVVEGDTVVVGRMDNCNLEIKHPDVSRRHLQIIVRDNQMLIEDLGSTNGTFVNKNRIPVKEPQPLRATDEVRFGNDGPLMKMELEISARPSDAPIGMAPSAAEQKVEVVRLEPAPPPVKQAPPAPAQVKTSAFLEAQHDIEKMLRDARQQVALTLQNAEVEAEQRVANIHQRAKDTEARAEKFYEDRLREAVQRSEKVGQDAADQSMKTIQESRKKAQELRDQAESQAVGIRENAERRCAELLDMAEERAQAAKDRRLSEADDIIAEKEKHVLKDVREQAEKERIELDKALQVLRDKRDDLQTEFNKLRHEDTTTRENLRRDEKRVRDTLASEEKTAREALATEQKKVRTELELQESATLENIRKETESSKAHLKREKDKVDELKAESKQLKLDAEKERSALTELRKEREPLQKESDSLSSSMVSLKNQLEQKSKELPAQLAQLKEQYEADRQKLIKEEEERAIQMKQATQQQVKKFEQELFADLQRRKENFTRELLLLIESAYISDLSLFKKGLPALGQKVTAMIAGESFSPTTTAKTNAVPVKVQNKRAQERNQFLAIGLAVGFVVMILGQWVVTKINSNPLERAVASAQEEQEKDLEARKFNPPQTPELRDTYVDAVIYTKDFTRIYLDSRYQDAYFKAATMYLLKTWRIDEDHSLQALSAAAALVKELQERKEAIHPDFVQKGLDQMKDLEKDTVARMKTILGGEVRLESLKKFEKQYYEKSIAQIRR